MRSTALALLCVMMTGGGAFAATGASTTTRTTANAVAPTGISNKFVTESDAARSCGASNVVWANTRSKAYHLSGDKYFGHTRHGAWMCLGTAKADGFHQAGMKGGSLASKG